MPEIPKAAPRSLLAAAALFASLCLAQCTANSGAIRTVETDREVVFQHIFDAAPPMSVTLVNGVLYEYSGVPSTSTPDWEIEVLAPRAWIDQTIREFPLTAAQDEESWAWNVMEGRRERAGKRYAPGSIDDYEGYLMTVTSIPYVQMLVERAPQKDGRHRVFVSKH